MNTKPKNTKPRNTKPKNKQFIAPLNIEPQCNHF